MGEDLLAGLLYLAEDGKVMYDTYALYDLIDKLDDMSYSNLQFIQVNVLETLLEEVELRLYS